MGSLFLFWALPYFLTLKDVQGSFYIFPVPSEKQLFIQSYCFTLIFIFLALKYSRNKCTAHRVITRSTASQCCVGAGSHSPLRVVCAISSQLHRQWHHVGSLKIGHGGSVYMMEIRKCYKSRLSFPPGDPVVKYQHTTACCYHPSQEVKPQANK